MNEYLYLLTPIPAMDTFKLHQFLCECVKKKPLYLASFYLRALIKQ